MRACSSSTRSLRSVKFGLYGLHAGNNSALAAFARRAQLAEEAGFESIWVGDHSRFRG